MLQQSLLDAITLAAATIAAVIVVVTEAVPDMILFDGGPLPRPVPNGTVPNPIFAAQRTIGSIAITYTGFVQVATDTVDDAVLFTVHPSSATQYVLPRVFVTGNGRLAANLSTTVGSETVIGPGIQRGVWFAFGFVVANGDQERRAAFYLEGVESVTALTGNLLPSGTALVEAGTDPRALLAQLRVVAGALNRDQWQQTVPWYLRYSWTTLDGVAVDAFSTDGAALILSCPDRIVDVRAAHWGRPIGVGTDAVPDPGCDAGPRVREAIAELCLRRRACTVPGEYAPDPCPGWRKWLTLSLACQRLPTSSTTTPTNNSTTSAVFRRTSALNSVPTQRSSTTAAPSSIVASGPDQASITTAAPSSNVASGPAQRSSTIATPTSSTRPRVVPPGPAPPVPAESTRWIARQISFLLRYRTEGFSDQERNSVLSTFVQDMSVAVQATPSRFSSASFSDQTLATTKLSFVVLPNSTDPDALQLMNVITLQLRTPGSPLRKTPLMSYYLSSTSDNFIITEVRAVRCGDSSSEIFSEDKPNACDSRLPSVAMSGGSTIPFLLQTYAIVFGTSLLTVILAVGCVVLLYCLRKRLLEQQLAQPPLQSAFSANGSPLINIVDDHGRVRGSALLAPPASSYLSTSPYRLSLSSNRPSISSHRQSASPARLSALAIPSPPPIPRSPRRFTNRDRVEKWQAENRVRFASSGSTESD